MDGATNWGERTAPDDVRTALESAGLSPILARLVASRGVTAEGLEEFFDPAMTRLAAAESLPGIREAVAVILPFIRDRREIVVFGDYDCDGVTASAILVTALRKLGGNAEAFIPLRFGEGYGMTAASLERLLAEHPGVQLVITVDNGITAPKEIAQLRARGITVVVTDHHLPDADLPVADALVNPRVAAVPGCEELCGAGVAFFLASALAKAATDAQLYAGPKFGGPLLVLAGLATVADLMPMAGQNRILVTQSLKMFPHFAPVGLRELYQRAARSVCPMVARDYGFTLAPRINAAGRMDTARLAYDLLMCEREEIERARLLAQQVDSFNAARKTEEQRVDREAREQVTETELTAVVVHGDDWHLGVAGIVASRLLETYHVPVAVAVGDTGSVRAPDGYNVHDALAAAGEHLLRFGGHAAAGGFTLKPDAFAAFKQAFAQACGTQRAAAPDAAQLVFDGWVEPGDLTLELFDEIARLEPFGEGNPEPLFGLKGVQFSDARPMGLDGRHASFAFVNRTIPRAVWWGHGADVEEIRAHGTCRWDVLFTLTTSEYGGEPRHVELRLVALRSSEFCSFGT